MEWAFVALALIAAVATTPTGRSQYSESRIRSDQAEIERTICLALVQNTPGKSWKDFPVCAAFIDTTTHPTSIP
jgi:hypothetical protein